MTNHSSTSSLILHIDPEAGPGYLQIFGQIQHAIQSGTLPEGCRLPSSRQLSAQMGVSRSMTVQAYDQLVSEGYLVSRPRRGIEVAANSEQILANPIENQPGQPRTADHQPISQSRQSRFDSGADLAAFPNKVWASAMRRSWLNPDPKVLHGDYPNGLPLLRQQLANYLRQARRLECRPQQIFITSGNRDNLELLQHLLGNISPTLTWCIEDPTFPPIRAALVQQKPHPLQQDDEGTCLPNKAITGSWAAVVTPNRHYPLGTHWNSERRQQWLQRAVESNSWIIEDDYDTEFVYSGRPGLPVMQTASLQQAMSERVILLGSLSKVLFRGLRLGYVVVPEGLVDAMNKTRTALGLSASLTCQPALADVMVSGQFSRHLNRMRRHYREKRDILNEAMRSQLGHWFEWQTPAAGMHFLLRFKSEWQPGRAGTRENSIDRQLYTECLRHGLRLSLLSDHYITGNETEDKGLIIGFTAPSIDQSLEWVSIIAAAMASLTAHEAAVS